MQGKTHRVGGVLCALIGYTVLEANNMLIQDVNPLLQLTVMYPFAIYGSTVSDLDHNWNSAPSKDPISKGINSVLHLTTGIRKNSGKSFPLLGIFDAKHRSWQTHSDIFLLVFMLLAFWLGTGGVSGVDGIIFRLIVLGFVFGLISHLILDAITPEGIWCLIPSIIQRKKVTFRLVPKSKFFATGGPWERLIRTLMWFAIILLFIYVIYKASPYRFSFNFT